jgi:hypothetical protein
VSGGLLPEIGLLRSSGKLNDSECEIPARLEPGKGGLTDEESKFTELQIAFALQQAERGTQVAEVSRKMGVSAGIHPARTIRSIAGWIAAGGVDCD